MRSSIRAQLFIQVTAIILLCVALILVLNSQFLSTVYVRQEKKNLQQVASQINTMDFSVEETYQSIMYVERQENLSIQINLLDGSLYYPNVAYEFSSIVSGHTISKEDLQDVLQRYKQVQASTNRTIIEQEKIDDKTGSSYFRTELEQETNMQYLVHLAALDNGYWIKISAKKNVIESNAVVASNFIWRIATITMLMACAVIYIYARKFTKPLIEMNRVTRNMAHMNFSQKCQIKRKDEIGQLGGSINLLSDSLDQTLKDLQEKNMQLEKDIERKQKQEQIRKEFISNISHELKTPIAIIQGYAEGLQIGVVEDPEGAKEYCDVIMEETQRMNGMVLELLELSQYELGAYSLNWEAFPIGTFVEEMLRGHKILFDEKRITVSTDIPQEAVGYGDLAKLDMVLNNYLVNAIAHAGAPYEIKISCEEQEDAWRISVWNTGNPIPEEDQEKIWISFYRGDKSHNRSGNRFGLGLSIVRALQNLHGQAYGVTNEGDGVLFWFDMAKQIPEEQAD